MLKKLQNKIQSDDRGISLIETLIGVFIIVIVSLALFALIDLTLKVFWETKARTIATSLANEKVELVRNLPYDNVGTAGGIPAGAIPQSETIVRNGISFTVVTSILYIDDPFDGIQGGTPDDTLPTDYKRMQLAVSWPYRITTGQAVTLVTDIAPQGVESTAGGGTLDISVFNAVGQPVGQAAVNIVNNSVVPTVNINAQTSDNGRLLLPGAPASTDSYEITVTKTGHSTDQTYAIDPVNLPTPIKPHLTVLVGQRTEASFAIDLLGTLSFETVNAVGTICQVSQYDESPTRLAASDNRTTLFEENTPWSWYSFSRILSSFAKSFNEKTTNLFNNTLAWLGSLFEQPGSALAQASWWNPAWQYRRQITFDNSAQSESHPNFPALIKLDISNFDFLKAQTNGEDVRFIDSNDTTELKYEIEGWDAVAQVAYIWVKVPQIDGASNTDHIYVYYGNAAALDNQDPLNVWDTNFKAVWHLGEGSGSSLADSTSNNNDATLAQTDNWTNSGKAGPAYDFDGTDDRANTNNTLTSFAAGTVDFWFVPEDTAFSRPMGSDDEWEIRFDGNGGNMDFDFRDTSGPTSAKSTWSVTWTHVAYTFDDADDSWTIYVDGSSDSSGTELMGNPAEDASFYIGDSRANGSYFDGAIDEIRLSDKVRSADWIAFEYCNMQQTCTSYGVEETAGPQTPTTNIYTIGTHSLNADIQNISGSGPWTIDLDPVDLSRIFVNDKFNDADGADWKITNVNDTADSLTVIDSEGNGGAPAAGGLSDWWSQAWTKRLKLTFDNSSQSENLNDFPVLVKLNSSRIDYNSTQDQGQDIRFLNNQTGPILLSYEIEQWDENGDSYVWVKVPQIDGASATDHIWMYYGNTSASDGQDAQNVWDANFKLVQHLQETTTGDTDFKDSTANNNSSVAVTLDGTGSNPDAVGQVDGAVDFDGSDDNINIGDPANGSLDFGASSSFTVTTWLTPVDDFFGWLVRKQDSSGSWQGYNMALDEDEGSGNSILYMEIIKPGPSGAEVQSATPFSLAGSSWLYAGFQRDGTTLRLFRDGVEDGTTESVWIDSIETTSPLLIGKFSENNEESFGGIIDEVRVSNTARSADWLAFEYCNMLDTCNTYGATETYSSTPGSGTVSRWFATMQAWEDARQGDLITRNVIEKGEMYNDSVFTGQLTIDGSITDATHYMHLTVPPGERHTGTAGTGVSVQPEDQAGTVKVFEPYDDYFEISYLDVNLASLTSDDSSRAFDIGSATVGLKVHHNIIHDDADNDGWALQSDGSNADFYNNVIYDLARAISNSGGIINAYNNSVYNMSDLGFGAWSGSLIAQNNIIMDSTGNDYQGGSMTQAYNMSSDTTASGSGSIINATTSDVFISITPGSENLHLKSTAGYYPFGPGDFSVSTALAVDAGDTASAFSNEPVPNGCRVNMGAFGNTAQASKTPGLGDPIPNIDITLRGSKLIGYDLGGLPVYKYSQAHTTDSNGELTLNNMEWDSYVVTVDPVTAYDVAYTDPPQPVDLLPNATQNIIIGLVPDTTHTLRVTVLDVNNLPLSGADVQLQNTGLSFDQTINTPSFGQAFFTPLSQATYNLDVTKTGYISYLGTVDVNNYTTESIVLVTTGSPPPPPPGPPPGNWWNTLYAYRRQITITNNDASLLPAHFPVKLTLDHAALVTAGKSLSNGNDVRVVFDNAGSLQEIDRLTSTSWNTVQTDIWLATQASIAGQVTDNNYWLYYDHPGAGAPPDDWNDIFLPENTANTKTLYHFENGSGTTVADTSGNSNNGAFRNMDDTNRVASKFAKGINFGVGSLDNYVETPNDTSLQLTDGTLEFWFKINTLNSGQSHQGLLSKDDSGFDAGGHLQILWDEISQYIEVRLQSTTASFFVYSPASTIVAGQWYHVAFSWGAQGMELYLNDSLVDINPYTGGIENNNFPFYVGASRGNNPSPPAEWYLDGFVDGLRISNTQISSFPYANQIAPSAATGSEEIQ